MIRTRVLLLCGGQSEEHEVSIASARSVLGAAGERFDITPLVVDRTGTLLDQANSLEALQAGGAGPHGASGGQLATLPSGFDVVFPLLHGPNGEDGSVQGLLQLAGLPHVGSGVLASAVGMDKIVMKQLFDGLGLPQVVFEGVTEHAWTTRPAQVMTRLDRLGYPVFVKPANLGSSVGISKAQDRDGLRSGLDLAFGHDRRAIVEQAASGARELEVAVLGNDARRPARSARSPSPASSTTTTPSTRKVVRTSTSRRRFPPPWPIAAARWRWPPSLPSTRPDWRESTFSMFPKPIRYWSMKSTPSRALPAPACIRSCGRQQVSTIRISSIDCSPWLSNGVAVASR